MMARWPAMTRIAAVNALFTLGLMTTASADVVTMDDFSLTLNGASAFNDTFGAGLTFAGGSGAVLPSGQTFSDGSPGFYSVIGTVTETGNKAILDTALGAHLTQRPPFFPSVNANIVTLLTGPPGSPFALTPSETFATSGLFDLSVPAKPGAFYQVNLSDRVPANSFLGDVISMAVVNCAPGVINCGAKAGPYIQLIDANAEKGTIVALDSMPLDTKNQQILLELTHPTAGSDTVFGWYAYVNGGVEGPLNQLGSYGGLFADLPYTETGFVQLTPAPEPSSIALLVSSIAGVLGLVWLERRKAAGCKRHA